MSGVGCRVSGGGCRVAGLAENITNSVKLELELGLSLAINELDDPDMEDITVIMI